MDDPSVATNVSALTNAADHRGGPWIHRGNHGPRRLLLAHRTFSPDASAHGVVPPSATSTRPQSPLSPITCVAASARHRLTMVSHDQPAGTPRHRPPRHRPPVVTPGWHARNRRPEWRASGVAGAWFATVVPAHAAGSGERLGPPSPRRSTRCGCSRPRGNALSRARADARLRRDCSCCCPCIDRIAGTARRAPALPR